MCALQVRGSAAQTSGQSTTVQPAHTLSGAFRPFSTMPVQHCPPASLCIVNLHLQALLEVMLLIIVACVSFVMALGLVLLSVLSVLFVSLV